MTDRHHGVPFGVSRVMAYELGLERLVGTEYVALADAVGRTLADPVVALADLPSVTTSAMDGWAVAGPPPWRIGTPIVAGDAPDDSTLREGHARPITTGGPVPIGAHAVLRSEHGVLVAGLLEPSRGDGPIPGRHLRRRGEEGASGDELIPGGLRLTAPRIALAAVSGVDRVVVRTRPTVDLLLLGSEVIDSGLPGDGLVRDAYTPQLPAVLASLGARTLSTTRVRDDRETTTASVRNTTADLVISTGGTAAGATDHIRAALTAVGARIVVDGIDVRPGHPTILAVLPDGRAMICLPGNPLAAMVMMAAIGVPVVDGLLGRTPRPNGTVLAAADFDNPSAGPRLTALRFTPTGAEPTSLQGSGMLRGLASSDGLAMVPAGGAGAGSTLDTVPTPW